MPFRRAGHITADIAILLVDAVRFGLGGLVIDRPAFEFVAVLRIEAVMGVLDDEVLALVTIEPAIGDFGDEVGGGPLRADGRFARRRGATAVVGRPPIFGEVR